MERLYRNPFKLMNLAIMLFLMIAFVPWTSVAQDEIDSTKAILYSKDDANLQLKDLIEILESKNISNDSAIVLAQKAKSIADKYENLNHYIPSLNEKLISLYQTNIRRNNTQQNEITPIANNDFVFIHKTKLLLIIAFCIVSILLVIFATGYFKNRKATIVLKQQKAEIESKNEELYQVQDEIIAQKDDLEKQRNEYQKLNTTKDKLFSILAHDLKNPFNTFINISELLILEHANLSEEKKTEMYYLINSSSKTTFTLLENLLNWARSQTGQLKIKIKPTDLYRIGKKNVDLLRLSAENKDIALSFDIKQNLFVNIDEDMIDTVLRNLLNNAIKFTEPGGNVNLIAEEKDSYVVVKVKDTGIGIREEIIPKLYNLSDFHTTPGTEKELGSGLGIIICKEFIERHGSNMEIESEVGIGTTFSFRLKKSL